MLGSEPLDEEIPIERSDLYTETQLVLDLYDKLQAKWEGMSGQFLGKELMLLPVLFKEYKTPKYLRQYAWDIIPFIDNFVAEDVAAKIKRKSKGAPSDG
jgi:hypothetical protein